jgi:hypothetical protein
MLDAGAGVSSVSFRARLRIVSVLPCPHLSFHCLCFQKDMVWRSFSFVTINRHAIFVYPHTWDREPLFHVSSPANGWEGSKLKSHHDYLNPADFPSEWQALDITVDVEAKAKEVAIARLVADLRAMNT